MGVPIGPTSSATSQYTTAWAPTWRSTGHQNPPPHNPFAVAAVAQQGIVQQGLAGLVDTLRRASLPDQRGVENTAHHDGLWRVATDGHVDTDKVLLDALMQRMSSGGTVVSPNKNGRSPTHQVDAVLQSQYHIPRRPASVPTTSDEERHIHRLTRRDAYSFERLSAVFHLPQHEACSVLRNSMQSEGQLGYKLSSLKLLIKCYNLQRWPYRKVGDVTPMLACTPMLVYNHQVFPSHLQVHAHLRHLSKAVSLLQAPDTDPMTIADARLQAASAIQQLCELYRVPRANMVPSTLTQFHELRARLDAIPNNVQ